MAELDKKPVTENRASQDWNASPNPGIPSILLESAMAEISLGG